MRFALAAFAVLMLGGCPDSGKQRPRAHHENHPARIEPKKARHASHEHNHGAHPHAVSYTHLTMPTNREV